MAPIPVTIITGFLGSGKTTLILNLIPQLAKINPSYKLALLKNEFGAVAVDSALAASASIAGVRELLHGCICCNLVGQLGPALAELAARARPDRMIIETSGSAFPATLAMEVNRLARQTGRYHLDGVVTVIDCENWEGYRDTSYTAKIQARYTDLAVFNKWEAVSEARFDECLDRLGDLEVPIAWVKSDRGQVSADVVFGVDGGLARSLEAPADAGHRHDQSRALAGSHQDEVEVLSVTLCTDAPGASIDTVKLENLLRTAPKDEIYRIKGVVFASCRIKSSDDHDGDASPDPPEPFASPRKQILNWAFGRWTVTLVPESAEVIAQASLLRMTLILARYEGSKWQKILEARRFIDTVGDERGTSLKVEKMPSPRTQ